MNLTKDGFVFRPLLVIIALSVAACASQPAADGDERDAHVIHSLAHDVQLAADATVVSARVTAGATLASILKINEVLAAEDVTVVQRTAAVFDPRKLRAQQPYRLGETPPGLGRRPGDENDGDHRARVPRETTDK